METLAPPSKPLDTPVPIAAFRADVNAPLHVSAELLQNVLLRDVPLHALSTLTTPASLPSVPVRSTKTIGDSAAAILATTSKNKSSAAAAPGPVPLAGADQAPASKDSQPNGSGSNSSDSSQHKDPPAVPGPATGLASAAASSAAAATADAPIQGTAGTPVDPSASALKAENRAAANQPDGSPFLPAAADRPLPASTGPVQLAQIVSKAAQSEMRIGLNTSAFGSVEVRTVVHANDVGVLIGSERGDLRSLFSTELPGIANSLQQQNLRLAQVNFHQSSAFQNDSSSGGNSQPRSYSSKPYSTAAMPPDPATAESSALPELSSTAYGSEINILA